MLPQATNKAKKVNYSKLYQLVSESAFSHEKDIGTRMATKTPTERL